MEKKRSGKSITVLNEDWKRESIYKDYPFRAAIMKKGTTEDMFPYVEFEQQEAESGNYAEICESFNGGVYIFAKRKPDKDINVKVKLMKLV